MKSNRSIVIAVVLSTLLLYTFICQGADFPSPQPEKVFSTGASLGPSASKVPPTPVWSAKPQDALTPAQALSIVSPNKSPYVIVPFFDWEMPAHFGLDANKNRIPDLPNTFEYVNNLPPGWCASHDCASLTPTFDIFFDASSTRIITNNDALLSPFHLPGAPTKLPGDDKLPRPSTPTQLEVRYGWAALNPTSGVVLLTNFTASPIWRTKLAEGTYDICLTVYLRTSATIDGQPIDVKSEKTLIKRIPVEDILIVSIGDSLSSGEGNPERMWHGNTKPMWADDGSQDPESTVNQRHRRAHRSTMAWPAQAALDIERADKYSSVSFISVATTGASINNGILAASDGAETEPLPDGGMIGQLDEVASLVGNRQIDVLTISVGANDVGFHNVITALLLAGASDMAQDKGGASPDFKRGTHDEDLNYVVAAANNGVWSTTLQNHMERIPGLSGLPNSFSVLASALHNRFPNRIRSVVLTCYPDPTQRLDKGHLVQCGHILQDVTYNDTGGVLSAIIDASQALVQTEIDSTEEQILVGKILVPLNQIIINACAAYSWTCLNSIYSDFAGHGYCAPYPELQRENVCRYALDNPFPDPVTVLPGNEESSWFRTAMQSREVQGPLSFINLPLSVAGRNIITIPRLLGSAIQTTGLCHPNTLGHQWIRGRLLESISLPTEVPGIGIRDSDNRIGDAHDYRGRVGDVIDSPTDVDVFKVDTDKLELTVSSPPTISKSLFEK